MLSDARQRHKLIRGIERVLARMKSWVAMADITLWEDHKPGTLFLGLQLNLLEAISSKHPGTFSQHEPIDIPLFQRRFVSQLQGA